MAFAMNLSAESEDSLRLSNISYAYEGALQQLTALRDEGRLVTSSPVPDAYSYQLMSSPTLYSSPLQQAMTTGSEAQNDVQLDRLQYINGALAQLYVQSPWLVTQTEEELREAGTLRSDVNETLQQTNNLADKVAASQLEADDVDAVQVETRKPNFWKFGGRFSAQFQQSHFSENWYQGGENNYAGNFSAKVTANYNNQKKINWENTLEAQLGFQTSKSDEMRAFRPTSNTLRLTTNFGYVAYKQLSYSALVVLSTQIVPNYEKNSKNVTSDIFSPLDVTIAPGMKYTFNWGKKVKFSGTINVAPLAYNIRYVDRDHLVKRYGINEGHNSYHNFGPNVDIRSRLDIVKNVTLDTRIFWFSNLHMTRIEIENTFNFKINKYLSSQLYLYPRFEDTSTKYRTEDGSYWMFKEWLSIGMNYDF